MSLMRKFQADAIRGVLEPLECCGSATSRRVPVHQRVLSDRDQALGGFLVDHVGRNRCDRAYVSNVFLPHEQKQARTRNRRFDFNLIPLEVALNCAPVSFSPRSNQFNNGVALRYPQLALPLKARSEQYTEKRSYSTSKSRNQRQELRKRICRGVENVIHGVNVTPAAMEGTRRPSLNTRGRARSSGTSSRCRGNAVACETSTPPAAGGAATPRLHDARRAVMGARRNRLRPGRLVQPRRSQPALLKGQRERSGTTQPRWRAPPESEDSR